MRSPRVILLLSVLLLAIALGSGFWLWQHLLREQTAPPAAAPTTTATAAFAALPTPSPLHAPPGYRLAGVAVGEPDSFAVVEAPNGTHTLYRLNDDVPDLGRLVRIETERVVVEGTTGTFEMWLAPAATASPTHTRKAATATPRATRRQTPRAGGTTPGSTPSAVPDRPAS